MEIDLYRVRDMQRLIHQLRRATCCVWAVLLLATQASAATLRVPEDYPTILAAVDLATAGDSVLVGPGTWTARDTRIISGSTVTACAFPAGGVSIIGSGAEVCTIDLLGAADHEIGVFVFAQAQLVRVEGFTFVGRTASGSFGLCVSGSVTAGLEIRRCHFVGNVSDNFYAAAVWVRECPLVIEDCEFRDNRSILGTVFVQESDIIYRRNLFQGNTGDGVHLDTLGNSNLTSLIEDSMFADNVGVQSPALAMWGNGFEVRRCAFIRNQASSGGGAILVGGDEITIEFNTFAYDSAGTGDDGAVGGAVWMSGEKFSVLNNTFVGCHAAFGSSIVVDGADLRLRNNIVAHSTGGAAIELANGGTIQGSCNDYWMNDAGDIAGGELDPSDISVDPQLCDLTSLDLTLHSTSPCTELNSGGCGLIGAWDVGCGPVSIQPTTWGRLKAEFREGGE